MVAKKEKQTKSSANNAEIFLEIRLNQVHSDQGSQQAYDTIYTQTDIALRDSFYLWLMDLLALQSDDVYLDVSCGHGQLTSLAQQHGVRAYGVDLSAIALRQGQYGNKQQKQQNLLAANAQQLPFAPRCFTVVSNIGSIEHYTDMDTAVSEIARVLKPGGRAMILLPNTFSLMHNLWVGWRYGRTNIDNQPIQRYAARREWQQLLESNGLVVDKTIKYEIERPRTGADFFSYLQPSQTHAEIVSHPFYSPKPGLLFCILLSQTKMIKVNCNYCGLNDGELVNQGPDLLLNRPGNFRLIRCRGCGLIYQNPRLTLDELSAHYPEEYQPYRQDIAAQDSALQRFDAQYGLNRRCRQLIRRHPQPAQLLDVGCATGLFLNAMRQYGWQVSGVELSPYAAEYARRTFGLDVITGTIETAQLPDNSYDVVTLWDVLEHVIDPKITLVEIGRILRPGGLLALSLPNPIAFEARLFGTSWVGWDRPRHLHLFTPLVLNKYLHDAGFQWEAIESLGGRLGLTLISASMLCRSRNISDDKSRPILDWIYNVPFRLITWPIYRIGELMNRATVMTVFARLVHTNTSTTQ